MTRPIEVWHSQDGCSARRGCVTGYCFVEQYNQVLAIVITEGGSFIRVPISYLKLIEPRTNNDPAE